MSLEARESFTCFGAQCAVLVLGDGPRDTAAEAVEAAKRRLLSWHERFTRFEVTSELSQLNADPRAEVPVSPDMARFAAAVGDAARETGGLVDATLLHEIESAGYDGDLRRGLPLDLALRIAPARRPAAPHPEAPWRELDVDTGAQVVRRPPGVALDSGGLAKGLFADLLAETLAPHESFAIDCAGDLRLGGAAGIEREVNVLSPFDGGALHVFRRAHAGVATSGIGKRSWMGSNGRPAHHLLDPATGRPAFTGIVQVTALGPTGLRAEMRSKAAILSGPDSAARWLPDGGVIVLDDGTHRVVEPA